MSEMFESLESRTLMSASSSLFPPGTTLPPILTTAGWRAVAKLDNELNLLATRGHISWAQIDGFEADAEAGISTVTAPSVASIVALKAEVRSAFSDRSLSSSDITALNADISAVLVSAGVTPDSANTVAGDFGNILSSPGLTKSDIRTIGNDLTATLATFRTPRT